MTKESAYKQTKPVTLEVYDFEDFRKIEEMEDVPLIVRFRNNVTSVNVETEGYIDYINNLLDRYIHVKNKKQTKKTKDLEENLLFNINSVYNKLIEEVSLEKEEIDFSDIEKSDEIRETLDELNSTVKYKIKPIDLTGRKNEIVIIGSDKDLTGFEIEKDSNAALFTNVNCDLTINNLNIVDLNVRGNNAALIAIGNEDKEVSINFNNLNISGSVTAKNIASELVQKLKGKIKVNKVNSLITVNGSNMQGDFVKADMTLDNFIRLTTVEKETEPLEDKIFVRTKSRLK